VSQNPHILDVGDGPGTYAEAFTEGGAQVTVFDLPEVVELMKEHLDAAGISAVGGDFNEVLPEGPFDTAYLGSVSHIYGPKENLTLIKRVTGSLYPGGLIGEGGACRSLVRVSARAALLHKATRSVRLLRLSLGFLPASRRKKKWTRRDSNS
jgi:hypothetical protein